MSVRIRKFRTGGYEVDIHTVAPDGERIRERLKSPVGSKEATRSWAALREAHLALKHGEGGCRCKVNGNEAQEEDQKKAWPVEKYLHAWIEQRRAEKVPSVDQEEQRLEAHVIPELGKLKMIDVRPKHAHQLVKALRRTKSRRGGVLAARTVRQIFFTAKQAFEEAVLDEILPSNPMIVRKGVLPAIEDKDPAWRHTAVFTGEEVEKLISDPKVAVHRRVAYAIEFLTGLRTGQVSALTWADYETGFGPLGRLTSAFSWDSKKKERKATKTKVVHQVPVHPTLAKVLAAWKLTGWAARMGRAPTPEDLIVPTINLTHRDVRKALEDFHEDLDRLKLRRRRHYDARRTFISLGLDGGASKEALKSITHPRPVDAFDMYRSLAWLARCEAVAKVKVELREGTLVAFPRLAAAGGRGELVEDRGSGGDDGGSR